MNNTIENIKDRFDDFIADLRYLSRTKKIFAGLIILAVLFMVFLSPRGTNYMVEVEYEIKLAKKICENSESWLLENHERLKLGKAKLDHILVDGKPVALKHIKYPRAILLSDGYRHPGSKRDFYCTFSDPRVSSMEYYYDYRNKVWVDKPNSRY